MRGTPAQDGIPSLGMTSSIQTCLEDCDRSLEETAKTTRQSFPWSCLLLVKGIPDFRRAPRLPKSRGEKTPESGCPFPMSLDDRGQGSKTMVYFTLNFLVSLACLTSFHEFHMWPGRLYTGFLTRVCFFYSIKTRRYILKNFIFTCKNFM